MNQVTVHPTRFHDAYEIIPTIRTDDRGFFAEIYNLRDFSDYGINDTFVQVNHSRSSYGVLRGLHYQSSPHAISKLVQCITGEIFDVIVDLRKDSKTYGNWQGFILTGENKHMVYVPEGFAHGFCVLSETADVMYLQNGHYAPSHDKGVRWNDPDIGIQWPITEVSVSPKDEILPFLAEISQCD